ncbi:MAG TPA: MgtC/SapB family protein [Stellaceae bacterium]|nr:MgtC/SapB family protein [Stellaceae bacterium]
MPTDLHWTDVTLRLALTVLAGLLIGYDRSEQGKASGMRTTVLVALAASVAMIEVNFLLPTAGRKPDSFVMNDLMRLPLGILTGVGFIGGGAILRRGDLVVGLTTASTLWLVTVIGLCLGAGLLALGAVATILGYAALWPLRRVENRLHQEHRERFSIELAAGGPSDAEVRQRLGEAGMTVIAAGIVVGDQGKHRRLDLQVQRYRRFGDTRTPAIIDELASLAGVVGVTWKE